MFWTNDIEWGLHILHKMWYFIGLFPILYTIVRKEYINYYVSAFLIAISITEICSYLVWFEVIDPFRYATVKNPTPFMSHISYNPYIAFAIYLVLNKLFSKEKMSLGLKAIYTFFALIMTFNMFITAGRAGQVMFFIALIVLALQHFRNSQIKATFIALLSIIFISFIASISVSVPCPIDTEKKKIRDISIVFIIPLR